MLRRITSSWCFISIKVHGKYRFLFRQLPYWSALVQCPPFVPLQNSFQCLVLDHWTLCQDMPAPFLGYECLVPFLFGTIKFTRRCNIVHPKENNRMVWVWASKSIKALGNFAFSLADFLFRAALSRCLKVVPLQIMFQGIALDYWSVHRYVPVSFLLY